MVALCYLKVHSGSKPPAMVHSQWTGQWFGLHRRGGDAGSRSQPRLAPTGHRDSDRSPSGLPAERVAQ
jgi:hypothetical protein